MRNKVLCAIFVVVYVIVFWYDPPPDGMNTLFLPPLFVGLSAYPLLTGPNRIAIASAVPFPAWTLIFLVGLFLKPGVPTGLEQALGGIFVFASIHAVVIAAFSLVWSKVLPIREIKDRYGRIVRKGDAVHVLALTPGKLGRLAKNNMERGEVIGRLFKVVEIDDFGVAWVSVPKSSNAAEPLLLDLTPYEIELSRGK